MASLREMGTGRYAQDALTRILGPDDADRTLCQQHHELFSQWLSFSLMEQKADLGNYLKSARVPNYALHYRHLVPRNAREVERHLYLTDLETVLELLRYEQAGAFEIPET